MPDAIAYRLTATCGNTRDNGRIETIFAINATG